MGLLSNEEYINFFSCKLVGDILWSEPWEELC